MPAQTTYTTKLATAYEGMVYAQSPHDIVSRAVETAAGIEFGHIVSRGTDPDNQVVAGGAAALGVTVRFLDKEGAANSGAIRLEETETAAVLRSGSIYVVCPAGCAPGDPVKYTTATGVIDAGAAAAGETALAAASWETSAAAGELAVLRVTL